MPRCGNINTPQAHIIALGLGRSIFSLQFLPLLPFPLCHAVSTGSVGPPTLLCYRGQCLKWVSVFLLSFKTAHLVRRRKTVPTVLVGVQGGLPAAVSRALMCRCPWLWLVGDPAGRSWMIAGRRSKAGFAPVCWAVYIYREIAVVYKGKCDVTFR